MKKYACIDVGGTSIKYGILKEDLIRAVEKEEYEKAADIRDKIKHLQKCNE